MIIIGREDDDDRLSSTGRTMSNTRRRRQEAADELARERCAPMRACSRGRWRGASIWASGPRNHRCDDVCDPHRQRAGPRRGGPRAARSRHQPIPTPRKTRSTRRAGTDGPRWSGCCWTGARALRRHRICRSGRRDGDSMLTRTRTGDHVDLLPCGPRAPPSRAEGSCCSQEQDEERQGWPGGDAGRPVASPACVRLYWRGVFASTRGQALAARPSSTSRSWLNTRYGRHRATRCLVHGADVLCADNDGITPDAIWTS